jgi:hypothetical protein
MGKLLIIHGLRASVKSPEHGAKDWCGTVRPTQGASSPPLPACHRIISALDDF